MSEPIEPRGESPRTLPEWLRLHADQRGAATALRHKQRGLWRSKSWRELEAEVRALAGGLRARGFVAGDRLLLDTPPVPEAFLLGLAALWLGGAVVVLEPARAPNGASIDATAVDANGVARFVLVADDTTRARHVASRAALALGVVLDADHDALADDPVWTSFEALAASPLPGHAEAAPRAPAAPRSVVPRPVATEGARAALIRWRAQPSDGLEAAPFSASTHSHDGLIRDARALATRGRWGAAGDALAGRELALGDRLVHVLPVWLVSGFCWSFVERAATEDNDRRELGPSLVFGSARDYASLTERVAASLPPRERSTGRWLHAVLDGRAGSVRWARRLLTARLREVTGLGRAERVVAVGDAARVAPGFEHLFGLSLFEWPEPAARAAEHDPLATASAARSSRRLVGFDAAEVGAAPRSDLG